MAVITHEALAQWHAQWELELRLAAERYATHCWMLMPQPKFGYPDPFVLPFRCLRCGADSQVYRADYQADGWLTYHGPPSVGQVVGGTDTACPEPDAEPTHHHHCGCCGCAMAHDWKQRKAPRGHRLICADCRQAYGRTARLTLEPTGVCKCSGARLLDEYHPMTGVE